MLETQFFQSHLTSHKVGFTVRRPLQPKKTSDPLVSNPIIFRADRGAYPNPIIPTLNEANKENEHPILSNKRSITESPSARLEKMRVEREITERELREKDRMLEVQMEELLERGEAQKELEIQLDRLYRLKELQLQCMRMSPIQSLRERELEKKKNIQIQSQRIKQREENVGESSSTGVAARNPT